MANNCNGYACGTGTWSGPLPGDPDNSSVLSAVADFGGIQLSWTMPNINGHAVAHTNIFRGISDVFETAIPLTVASGSSYFDKSAADVIRPYYYWIQHVSINGTTLGVIGPASAVAMPLINQVIQALANKIENSMLAESLRERIDRIADLDYGLTDLSTQVVSENQVFTQELLGLRQDLTDALAYVQESRTLEVSERQALVTALNTQVAQLNDTLYAAIQEEAETRADETGALFAQKTLKLDLAGNVVGYGLSATIDPDGTFDSSFQVRADSFSLSAPAVSQATAPANPFHGKVWVDTSVTPNVTRWYNTNLAAWQTTPVKGSVPFIVRTTPQVIDGYTVPAGVYIDTAVIDRLTADKIDTRGLTIKDPAGNVILAAGSSLDWSKLGGAASNLAGLGYTGALDATRNVYRGAWNSGVNYTKGDIVIYDNYGWSCETNHTSSGSITPPTYPATNSYWTLAAVAGGSGVNGADAVSAILSNEAHVFSAAADGTVSSYTDSGTLIRVYEGATELQYDGSGTANGTWKVTTAGTNITPGLLTDSGSYVTVGNHSAVAAGTDTASITYTITGRSSEGVNFSITKKQTFSKSKAGATGAVGTAYWLQSNAPTVQKSAAGAYTPTAVVYSLMSATGTNAPAAYAGRFIIATSTDGSTYTDQYTSTANESSKSFTVPAGIKTIRVRAYLAGGVATLIDEQLTTVVSDGASGSRTAVLEMYQWAAAAPTTFPSGNSTYTWSTGQFTAPATPNGWSLTPPSPVVGQTLWVCRAVFVDSLTTATSSVIWPGTNTAVPAGASGTNGNNGANGTRTAVLELYRWAAAAPTGFPSGTSTYTWNTGVFTAPTTHNGWSLLPGAPVAGQTLWACSVTYADTGTTSTSSVTWPGINTAYAVGAAGSNGTGGITALLSNEVHTFPASSTGAVSTYIGSGTEVRVYEGATELSYDGIGTANGTWKVTVSGTNITPGALTDSGTYLTVANHSGVADGTDTSSITYTITGKTLAGGSFTLVKAQTFSKAKQGGAGSAVVVTANRATSFTATDGTLDVAQADIVFTAAVSGISSPTYVWSFSGFQTAPTNSGAASQTITAAQFGTSKSATVTCTVNGTFKDVITIVRLEKTTAAPGATVGATIGVNLGGKITSGNASTFIDNAAIRNAQIGGTIQSDNYSAGAAGWKIDKDTGAAEFGAASIRDQLQASQIDTRGLSIKDAAGNVVLSAGTGFGKNLCSNSEMLVNPAGWGIWTRVGGTNLSNNNPVWQAPNTTFAPGPFGATNTAWNGGTDAFNACGSLNMYNARIPVIPGQRLEAQALITIAGGFADLNVAFLDAGGGWLGASNVAGGLSRIQDESWQVRAWGFVTAPANAASAYLDVPAWRTRTDRNTDLIVAKPYLGYASQSQTAMTPWTPGPHQINGSNISTYIADLSVDTLQIKGNAVTVPVAASWSGAINHGNGLPGAGYSDLVTTASTNFGGQPVFIIADVSYATGMADAVIKRNGWEIGRRRGSIGSLGYSDIGGCATICLLDYPGGGSHTYTVGADGGWVRNASIIALGVKR